MYLPREPFGFMGAKYQCQVCEKVVCKKCIKKLSLLPPSNEIVNACRRCHAVIKFMKVTKKLSELRNGSNNDALSQFYIDLKNASSQIDTNLPKLQGYIYSLSSIFGDNYDEIISTNIDDMKPFDAPYSAINDLLTAATKITPLLDSNFKKIETLIKRLPELMGIYPSPRYQRVFSMLKIRFNSHIQSSLPSFRISNTRLRDILSHSKIKRIVEESRLERREMDDKERYLSQVKTQNINITESDRLGTPISSSKIQQPTKTQTEHKIEEPSPVVTFQTSRKWGPT